MTNTEITLPDEFASTMQRLIAEAEKTISPPEEQNTAGVPASEMRREFAKLEQRLGGLEKAMTSGLAQLAASQPKPESELTSQLESIDEQLSTLCKTESVNQRLFNSLHQELKDYRDNFLRESLQKPFIRDLVILLDDLSSLSAQMQSASAAESKQGAISQWQANLENAIHALIEVLHRMEVNEIEPREMVDRALHRVVSYEPADFAEDDGRIVMRVKRGFVWHDQVLRPEEVVAKRFG